MITSYIDLEHRKWNIIILCGGLGTRLGAQSQHLPKAMSSFGESIAIDVLIQQFENVAHKYIIGTSTHAHLLQAHIKGSFPNHNIVFSREDKLVSNTKSFMYALDNTDSRYPTVLHYCDLINLGSPIVEPDCFNIVNENTKGHRGTYRHGLLFNNVIEYVEPQTTGMCPIWTFGDTVRLKKLMYSNPDAKDAVDIIKQYHNENNMKSVPVKMLVEFGTEADLQAVRKIWETI